jgi:hypothetical protein
VRVTFRLAVSQSVCLGVEPRPGLMTRYLFWIKKLQSCPYGAPSLTRSRVCLLPVIVGSIVHCHLYSYLQFALKLNHMYNIYKASVSPGSVQQILPYFWYRSPYLYPQEQGGPVIPPGTGLTFRSLLRLAGLRWRYSTPPPHGMKVFDPASSFIASALSAQKTPLTTVSLLSRRCNQLSRDFYRAVS